MSRETKEERQIRLIELVTVGRMSITKACERMGMARTTYEAWRKDPAFVEQFEQAKAEAAAHPETQAEAGQLHGGGFAGFRKRFFGFETYVWQQSVVHSFETAEGMSITLVLVPPNHGKSTLVEDWINYKLAVEPNHRILVLSESKGHAKKLVARVKNRMTDRMMSKGVADYIDTYGPFLDKAGGRADGQNEKAWTTEYITVARANHDERDFSLEAKGWTSQIYGARADTIILDDVQSLKTANRTKDLIGKFRQDVVTRPGQNGRIIIVGTRVALGDFYEALVELDIITAENYVEFPAVLSEGPYDEVRGEWGCYDETGEWVPGHVEPLCPEMWPPLALGKQRKLVGRDVWWRAYMMRPQAAGDATFTDEMLDAADDPCLLNEAPTRTDPDGTVSRLGVVTMVDPALGGGNAVVTAAWDYDRFYVIDARLDFGLARNEDIFDRLELQVDRHRPTHVIIERTAMQRGIARDDRLRAMALKYGFMIVEHETAGNKMDAVLGVGQMAGGFLRREISMAAGTPSAKAVLASLRAELRAWRPNIATRFLKQDTVMALWFGWRWWMQQKQNAAQPTDAFKVGGMPFKKTTAAMPSRKFTMPNWGARKKAA